MKTTVERMRQAERELEQRRSQAEKELQRRRQAVYEKVPALAALEREIAESGAAVVGAIGAGQDASGYLALLEEQNTAAQAEQARLLRENGFAADYLQPQYSCAECRDTGFTRGMRCDCFTKLLRSLAYRELSMDTPLERCSFESFRLDYYATAPDPATGVVPRENMKGVLDYCTKYAGRFSPRAKSLLFTGDTGLGKTHLSLAIARAVLEQGYTVIYGSAQNLLSRLQRERFAPFGEQGDATERSLLECDLLILDDLGAEHSTAFTKSSIYNIVNTRMMASQPVIVSTNLSVAQLGGEYGERVASRVLGTYTVLRFFGSDVRQAKLGGK
ncbi:MAG: ATP-binding protein [Firmicutes bacterium]|nr:ATP-binding protein [Bacillota bacterium]